MINPCRLLYTQTADGLKTDRQATALKREGTRMGKTCNTTNRVRDFWEDFQRGMNLQLFADGAETGGEAAVETSGANEQTEAKPENEQA